MYKNCIVKNMKESHLFLEIDPSIRQVKNTNFKETHHFLDFQNKQNYSLK